MTTAAGTLTLDQINLAYPDLFEQGRHHEAFRLLRRERPIHWNEGTEDIKGFWSVVRFDDVVAVSRRPDVWSSERGIVFAEPRDEQEATLAANGNGKMLITMDPPRHVRLRRLVNKGFTPRAVAAMEEHIRGITESVLDDIAEKGEVDFVTEVAALIPLAVICEMMGVPKSEWQLMFTLTNKVLGGGDPEYQTDVPEEQRGTPEAARITGNMGTMQMFGYFAQLLQQKRAESSEDLIGLLVGSEVDGEKLTDEDILWFCFLLILAGNETTRNAMSGGLLALFNNPDQREKLQDDLSLLPSAVEEIIRYVSPVTHMARIAMQDTEVGGVEMRKGERVVMWYPSANRDEKYYPDGDVFDITRSPNDHIAFGIGEHFCLGAGFARLEIKLLFEQLLTRFPDIRQAGPEERLRSNFIGGIKHLPVAFTPEK
ncbi:MAG: cytochrome P450 [Dehalococcoidia bacterium]|nr:cytochrome P450 [Dehalococcoidia bacterium]